MNKFSTFYSDLIEKGELLKNQAIVECLSTAIKALGAEKSLSQIESLLEVPRDEKLGDVAFPCFVLAKELKQAPPKIAASLIDVINDSLDKKVIASAINTGPYLNFKLNTQYLAEALIPKVLDESFLAPEKKCDETMMIEYSQPNTHKAFHVGHTRNLALGDALVRMNEWAGFDVIGANYIGDVGTHIAKCLWYLNNHFKGEIPKNNLGEFLGEMYVNADKLLDFKKLTLAPHPGIIAAKVEAISDHPKNKNWKVVQVNTGSQKFTVVCGGDGYKQGDIVSYAAVGKKVSGREILSVDKQGVISEGVICSEKELSISDKKNKIYVFKSKVTLGEEVANLLALEDISISQNSVVDEIIFRKKQIADVLKSLETGEKEITDLWMKTRKWSLDEFNSIYEWFDTRFKHFFYESEVGDSGKKIVNDAYEKGIFIKSEGAIGADLSEFKLPFFLLLKSNGTGLYSTKDLSLAELKFNKFKVDRNVYVVDVAQSLHFDQVFATLKLLNFENADKCYHLSYGQVVNIDGSKMSSRAGNTILFSDLKNLLLKKIKEEFLSKYSDAWPQDEIEKAAHHIALATIKYGMLNQDSVKNILFELNDWTSKSGNTGPYMMYAFARVQSMLRDSKVDLSTHSIDYSMLKDESEHKLLIQINRFRDVAIKAAANYEPHLLCMYMYDLAKVFSAFYSKCSVLKAEDEDTKLARLAICKATALTLKTSLGLIGVPTIDRM